jgi:CDP-glucose 4,6-dehydratase
MTSSFWHGTSVLVTGHTGFKGSWLALWLQQLGARVTGLALAPPTSPSLFEQARIADGMTSRHGDIRDLACVLEVARDAQPRVIFHLAAQSLVRASYEQPVETYATNTLGTVHVLEAARQVSSVRAVVIVTTDKCYENREWLWPYREVDALGGRDPYSNSKACAELVTDAYRKSFLAERGVAVGSARAGNVIGGGDWARDRIVPDAMRAFATGATLDVRNPASTRPWQHVLEPLAGYLLLAERLLGEGGSTFADAWNFGPTDEQILPVGELATRLARAWGDGASWRAIELANAPHEARLLRLDASKARERLGWRPMLSMDETLAWIVEWHRAVATGGDARAIVQAQLERYAAIGRY